MDKDNLILLVSGLVGTLGVKEIWSIIKKNMDMKYSIKSKSNSYKEKRIQDLEEELKKSNELVIELTIRVSKLEERMLHVAKNRVKNKHSE